MFHVEQFPSFLDVSRETKAKTARVSRETLAVLGSAMLGDADGNADAVGALFPAAFGASARLAEDRECALDRVIERLEVL